MSWRKIVTYIEIERRERNKSLDKPKNWEEKGAPIWAGRGADMAAGSGGERERNC